MIADYALKAIPFYIATSYSIYRNNKENSLSDSGKLINMCIYLTKDTDGTQSARSVHHALVK